MSFPQKSVVADFHGNKRICDFFRSRQVLRSRIKQKIAFGNIERFMKVVIYKTF